MGSEVGSSVVKFNNCTVLKDHKICKDDVWVQNGKIVDPQKLFFDLKLNADIFIDCNGGLIAPGYIDVQINGAFGVDFSHDIGSVAHGVKAVAQGLLSTGVTSFCPTIVTSPKEYYHKILAEIQKCDGSAEGAGVLGVHLEGPFINKVKKGAHSEQFILDDLTGGIEALESVYGTSFYDNTAIVTLAPELPGALRMTQLLSEKGIIVSMGHSEGTIKDGEKAVGAGATFITHLFNAMLPFHHRDPGLVGLLTSWKLPTDKSVYYGLISDGIHTHPASLRIAQRVHTKGLILVTDAMGATGLPPGTYHLGQQSIEITEGRAYVAGTQTLAGSIATMDSCVKVFYQATDCSKVEALEAASLHPAELLGITHKKGTLNYGCDADFILLDDNLDVTRTYIAGRCVWKR